MSESFGGRRTVLGYERYDGRSPLPGVSEDEKIMASLQLARASQALLVDDFVCGGEILIRKEDQQATLDKIDECIGYLSKRLASS